MHTPTHTPPNVHPESSLDVWPSTSPMIFSRRAVETTAGGNWGFPVGTWGNFFENLEGPMEVRVLDSGSHGCSCLCDDKAA